VSSALQMLQSSSPSNLLLASLEGACHQMLTQGHELLAQTLALAHEARENIAPIAGLRVLQHPQYPTPGFCDLDRTRLTVDVSALGLDGFTADEICTEQFGVIAELPTLRHLTFLLSLGNTPHDLEQLRYALEHLSQHSLPTTQSSGYFTAGLNTELTQINCPALSPRDAYFAPRITMPIAQAVGHVSAETLCPYPPGIAIILPGEAVAEVAIAYLQKVQAAGGLITGCLDSSLQKLQVVKQ
jgi:arginine decarboxylase